MTLSTLGQLDHSILIRALNDDFYPVLSRIGGFEVTSFGVLAGIAAFVSIWGSRS
jgi:hypothetical protein